MGRALSAPARRRRTGLSRDRRKAGAIAQRAPDTAAGSGERSLDRHLGATIRALRQKNRLTIGEVAAQAALSAGMLSKIENGQASTSLDSLQRIATALGVTIAELFRDYGAPAGGAQVVKSGAGMEVVRRGTKRGHTYHLLAYDKGPRKAFEPFLITLDDASETFPRFEHPGTEFIYMLQGKIEYRHGQETHVLEPGDALTFRGEVSHGPERLIELPIRFLSIIIYVDEERK
jgi:ribosome-binding protein aMBF1 (putative translation factor)